VVEIEWKDCRFFGICEKCDRRLVASKIDRKLLEEENEVMPYEWEGV
jgi:hypothetical protein